MFLGLLGNIGQKSEIEDWYLGVCGIKFYCYLGVNLSKKFGCWIVCVELVEIMCLFGCGIVNIEL